MTQKRLTYSTANMHAGWEFVDGPEHVQRIVDERVACHENGEKNLADFTFAVRAGDLRPMLIAGEFELEFSRLGWSRFTKALGITRDFVLHRLKGGETGRHLLTGTVNDIMKAEQPARTLMLYRHPQEPKRYTIRDLLRAYDRELDVSQLWDYVRDHDAELVGELACVRLTDFGHQFRYLLPETKRGGRWVFIDLCYSMGRRLFYAQASFGRPLPSEVVSLQRLDMKEIKAKEFFPDANHLPEASRLVRDAAMEYLPHFESHIQQREQELEEDVKTQELFALFLRSCKNRVVRVQERNAVVRELVNRAAAGVLEKWEILHAIAEVASKLRDPEMSNRLERVAYDVEALRVVPQKPDYDQVARYLKEREMPQTDGEPVSSPSFMGGNASVEAST